MIFKNKCFLFIFNFFYMIFKNKCSLFLFHISFVYQAHHIVIKSYHMHLMGCCAPWKLPVLWTALFCRHSNFKRWASAANSWVGLV
jgi:hypothetical protein